MSNERWVSHRTIREATKDIKDGIKLFKKLKKEKMPIITIMGSARESIGSLFYDHSKLTAKMLGEEGYGVLTGGGSGIMRAANEGAMEAGTRSIGIQSGLLKELRKEQSPDDIYTDLMVAKLIFFSRRFLLLTPSLAHVIYPGGFGTFDETFELLMLMQNGIVDEVPIFFVEDNKKYWSDLTVFIEKHMMKQVCDKKEDQCPEDRRRSGRGYINKKDLNFLKNIINIDELGFDESAGEIVKNIERFRRKLLSFID